MQTPNEKTAFQVERIAFFSDAVFAIAITLMIIEVKAPHLPVGASATQALDALAHLVPIFLGLVMSFGFIGLFWYRHHQLFKHLHNYNGRFVFINMMFLLSVCFIPFSTIFHFENLMSPRTIALPLILYNINYILATFFCYRLFRYSLNPANGLCNPGIHEDHIPSTIELLFPILVFLFVILLCVLTPLLAPLGYGAFGLQTLFMRKRKKQQIM